MTLDIGEYGGRFSLGQWDYRVEDRGHDSPCWVWLRFIEANGYGAAGRKGRDGRTIRGAHRWTYDRLVGPIPEGLQLDHLCRVRACVNPAHLEPVTSAENSRRGAAVRTHCPRGHEYAPANTYMGPGGRECRTCGRARVAAYDRRKREADRIERVLAKAAGDMDIAA